MFRAFTQKCRRSIQKAWSERNLDPWTNPDVVLIQPPGTDPVVIDLGDEGKSYSIGSDASSQIKLGSGPPKAAELKVLGPDDGLLFTPFRAARNGQDADADDAAAVRVDAGNSVEVSGHVLSITDPRPTKKRYRECTSWSTRFYVHSSEWFNPFLAWSPRFLKTFSIDLAHASRGGTFARVPLLRKLGAVAHDEEEHAAEVLFQDGRRAFWLALLVYAVLCVLVVSSLPAFGQQAASVGVALLIISALVATIITSACSAGGTALFAAICGVVIGNVALRIESTLRDTWIAAAFTLLFGLIGAVIGYYLESTWSPLPNVARRHRNHSPQSFWW